MDTNAHTEVKMGSERSFAQVFCVVFVIIALWPVMRGTGDLRIWAFGVAAVILFLGYVYPAALKPLNRLWFVFGMLLSRIVSPIVMGLIFFLAVTPTGLIRRLRYSDPLNQKLEKNASTYWVLRKSQDGKQTSMRKQF